MESHHSERSAMTQAPARSLSHPHPHHLHPYQRSNGTSSHTAMQPTYGPQPVPYPALPSSPRSLQRQSQALMDTPAHLEQSQPSSSTSFSAPPTSATNGEQKQKKRRKKKARKAQDPPIWQQPYTYGPSTSQPKDTVTFYTTAYDPESGTYTQRQVEVHNFQATYSHWLAELEAIGISNMQAYWVVGKFPAVGKGCERWDQDLVQMGIPEVLVGRVMAVLQRKEEGEGGLRLS